jgi:ATP-dependent exoDNAse (exonuclease V) alpha subunit
LLPQSQIITQIREMKLDPACSVDQDLYTVVEDDFKGVLVEAEMYDGLKAYQLERLSKMASIIRREITRRRAAKRILVSADWRALLDEHLLTPAEDEAEEKARTEKTQALKELAESRFSVLIGPAGTGKTTLLSVLCSQQDIAAGEILLLAPTGKARVRMEQAAKGLKLKAYTLAQFLSRCNRYDGFTQRYC